MGLTGKQMHALLRYTLHMRLLISVFWIVLGTVTGRSQQSWNVSLLCHWNDTANIRSTGSGQRYNDVWGFVWKGREYAAIGSTEGVHIIDLDDCRQVAFHPGRDNGSFVVHRDYKTYKNYLYAVCDEGENNLQVFDLNYLPDSLHLVYESDPMDFMLSHNIFIDTAKGTLYACSVKSMLMGNDHMRVYSLADPKQPALLTRYNMNNGIHDVYVRNDTAFCSASSYGYEVVDFTSHTPTWQNIAELRFYPYQGYNHSSWIGDNGFGVMADESHGSPLKIIDTRNLGNIQVVATFSPRPNDTTCVPHNPFIVGSHVFVAYYMDGLQVYDVTDPYNPVRTGYYDTYPGPDYKGFAGAWGCYPFLPSTRVLISDMQTGLYVLDASAAAGDTAVIPEPEIFSLFPNPFADYLDLTLTAADTGQLEVLITDMLGRVLHRDSRKVYNYTIQPIRLTLPGYWQPGLYAMHLTIGGREYRRKILKS